MKIQSVTTSIGTVSDRAVSGARDKNQNSNGKQENEQQKNEQDSNEKPEEPFHERLARLANEVKAFADDPTSKLNGLSAEVTQDGTPGLRVVLKDGKGAVLRLISGEEFLELRQTLEHSKQGARGGLLNQKI